MTNITPLPTALVFAGHDPSGGAGIQADIETLRALDCHPTSVVTTLTVQDTHGVHKTAPVDPNLVGAAADAILSDLPVLAIKIGLIDNLDTIEVIAKLLRSHPYIPVVLDPVMTSGGHGSALTSPKVVQGLIQTLLPLTHIITPNSNEARALTNTSDPLAACGPALCNLGSQYSLITGEHENQEQIENILYSCDGPLQSWTWPRLPNRYHGSGCTLASAIAAGLAHQKDIETAVAEAQSFTHEALEQAYQPGGGQHIPLRRRKFSD